MKKKKMNSWLEALKAYNAKKGGKYMIPKKGTAEYEEVRKMMGEPKKESMPKMEEKPMMEKKPKMARKHKMEENVPENFIASVVAHMKKGAMTKAAERHGGKTALEYAKEVLAHPEDHTMTTRRRAQFLVNIHKE